MITETDALRDDPVAETKRPFTDRFTHGAERKAVGQCVAPAGGPERERESTGKGSMAVFKVDNVEDLYEMGDVLGSGHFGQVREVRERATGACWAGKFLKLQKCASSRLGMERKKVEKEVEILQVLQHPNIMALKDVFESRAEVVLIVELISGGELFDFIAEKDNLSETEAIGFIKQILEGLRYMHSKNIAHFDLKPENIMLSDKDAPLPNIKIIDFGLAQHLPQGEEYKSMAGTPQYIGPEVINYEPLTVASDMWSIGVITYILLSGMSPFQDYTDEETLKNIIGMKYTFDERHFKETTEMAKDFIQKLLVKDQSERMSGGVPSPSLDQAGTDDRAVQADDPRCRSSINMKNFKKLNARRKWKMSYNMVRACTRLSRLQLLCKTRAKEDKELRQCESDQEDSETHSASLLRRRLSSSTGQRERNKYLQGRACANRSCLKREQHYTDTHDDCHPSTLTSPPHSPEPPLLCVPYPAAPPCSPCPSPPPPQNAGRAPGGVTLRDLPTRHLARLDAWRRHSWEPGAVAQGSPQYENRSVSLEDLDPEEMEKVLGVALGSQRDPRRTPIIHYAQELGSLQSLTEEEVGPEPQRFSVLEGQSSQLQGCSASAPSLCGVQTRTSLRSARPTARPRSHCYESSLYSQVGGSTQSVDAAGELGSVAWGREERTEGERDSAEEREREEASSNPLERTLSFLRKMAGNRKNKEKERMKEREKEAREREARYSNGHLFTSLTVSGTTLCSACNKSITAKEALSCPTCNVTIHNRCRDTLPNCAKMKQRQQKLALVRNSSAMQGVTLRNKTPMMKERPSSAIYPSESLRQSLLGSRRGRSGLSLSKSVSTNNIAGNLNDDSPLGLRRILSQSTESLNFRNRAMSMESLNDEGEVYYASMLEELERDGQDFEADSWSMAVDSSYLQTHRKDVIKRQDVIYELIQTELHHVRTLRIMEGVFRRGMLEEVMLEPGVAHAVFPCLDRLLALHTRFLSQLLARRSRSLQPGSAANFTIHQLGDLLLEQFSAVKLYKELLARDKRFKYFIRRVSRGHLLRRHGVQECILLVTQRITKYPVLIQRILDNTKGSVEEADSLSQALVLIREMLCSVDQQVLELERTHRLQEVRARLDPRAEAEVRGGGVFRGGELMRRRLIHEGTLLWKTGGSRLKDIQVLLMTDILVFLQEKDQKFIFPCLDKSPVLSLKNLIVRDIANQERGMFLISDSTPPEMYELHAASKDDRNTWKRIIEQTVSSCPSREDFPLIETEDKALLRRLRADIQQKDREVLELLQERLPKPLPSRHPRGPERGERLLTDAIADVDRLSELLLGTNLEAPLSGSSNGHQNHRGAVVINGQEISINGTHESPVSKDRNGNQVEDRPLNEEVCHRLVNLSVQLHALQAVVIRQDSILEHSLREGSVSTAAPPSSTPIKLCRSLSRDTGLDASAGAAIGDLALLQRQHSLLQEELVRLRAAEGKLRDSEKARAQLEKQVKDMKAGSAAAPVDNAGTASSEQALPPQHKGSEVDPSPVAPLASQESGDQSQEGSDEEEEVDVGVEVEVDVGVGVEVDVKVSPRPDSPRDLQDIPEESESGAEPR
ncbi:hypothetical protein AAFF_G00169280 [Aldrovandia affinis]|uniref:Uncharacterized protein n=1 Tax=Aldrovandia affinis TaxID=143900 RepID=A0AAD7W7Q2_9TELE|nr:hypothetical protein AAFF_G00169280 [Aldrovandia affinis]